MNTRPGRVVVTREANSTADEPVLLKLEPNHVPARPPQRLEREASRPLTLRQKIARWLDEKL